VRVRSRSSAADASARTSSAVARCVSRVSLRSHGFELGVSMRAISERAKAASCSSAVSCAWGGHVELLGGACELSRRSAISDSSLRRRLLPLRWIRDLFAAAAASLVRDSGGEIFRERGDLVAQTLHLGVVRLEVDELGESGCMGVLRV